MLGNSDFEEDSMTSNSDSLKSDSELSLHELEQNIFDTRDLPGNERNMDSILDSDGESNVEQEGGNMEEPRSEFLDEEAADHNDNSMLVDDEDGVSVKSSKTSQVLAFLDSINFKCADFLDGLSWGDRACVLNAKIRVERTVLLQSPILPEVLRRWAKPPRPHGSSKRRPQGASAVVKGFCLEYVGDLLNNEMEDLAGDLRSPPTEDVNTEILTQTTFAFLVEKIQEKAPAVWIILRGLAFRPNQEYENKHKNHEKVS